MNGKQISTTVVTALVVAHRLFEHLITVQVKIRRSCIFLSNCLTFTVRARNSYRCAANEYVEQSINQQ